MEEYSIEELEKKFKEHSEIFGKDDKTKRETYPEYNRESFNIAEALHVICREINEIKSTLDRFEKDIY